MLFQEILCYIKVLQELCGRPLHSKFTDIFCNLGFNALKNINSCWKKKQYCSYGNIRISADAEYRNKTLVHTKKFPVFFKTLLPLFLMINDEKAKQGYYNWVFRVL